MYKPILPINREMSGVAAVLILLAMFGILAFLVDLSEIVFGTQTWHGLGQELWYELWQG